VQHSPPQEEDQSGEVRQRAQHSPPWEAPPECMLDATHADEPNTLCQMQSTLEIAVHMELDYGIALNDELQWKGQEQWQEEHEEHVEAQWQEVQVNEVWWRKGKRWVAVLNRQSQSHHPRRWGMDGLRMFHQR
jgi:hypothetical protein